MNKKIEKLSSKNDYEEIFRIVQSKTSKPSLIYKDLNLTEADFLHLKRFTTGCILKSLHSTNSIPNTLVELSMLLGEQHVDSLKTSICSFIISRKMLDISQYIQDHFQDLSSLRSIFYFVENTLEKTYKEYENLPHSWDLDLKILIRSLVTLKQIICDYFFCNEPDKTSLNEGIRASIAFEKKLNDFFNLKKCCVSNIEFYEEECFIRTNQTDVRCIHKRMISSLFIPYGEIFIYNSLSRVLNTPFEQSKIEKNIIKIFIDFFSDLENTYEVLCHYEEKSVFITLFTICDRVTLSLLQKIRIDEDPSRIMFLYSTILYVQKVIDDFSNGLAEKYKIECISRSLAASRKLERSIDLKIERELFNNYPETIEKLPESIEDCFDNFIAFDDEVKKNVFEICMVQLLLKIGKIKLNAQKARTLLKEVSELEIALQKKFKVKPNVFLITDYLKIQAFAEETPNIFLQNFRKISNGKFDINQILKALEDQQAAQQIYQHYINEDKQKGGYNL